jgi:hypothetical protein
VNDRTAQPLCRPLVLAESGGRPAGGSAAAEFERLYRANVEPVTSFFARRSADPETVADLTADTFVQVIISLGGFDPAKGTARGCSASPGGSTRRTARQKASGGTRWCGWPAAGGSPQCTGT